MTSASNIDAGGAGFKLSLQDDLTKEIDTAMKAAVGTIKAGVKAVNDEIRLVGRAIRETGRQIAGVGASVAAVGGAVAFGLGKATASAGDLQATISMFEAVFKKQSTATRQWANDFRRNIGLAESEVLRLLATAQDTFIPLGFDRREATEFSKTVATLAADLAAFKGDISTADAGASILRGLTGETENLKKFGVIARDAEIRVEALNLGFDPKNLTAYQKALSILNLVLKGTVDAQGAAARNANTFNAAMMRFASSLKDLKDAIGTPLLDAMTSVVSAIASITNHIADAMKIFPGLSKVVATAAASMIVLGTATSLVGLKISSLGSIVATGGILALGFGSQLKTLAMNMSGVAKAAGAATEAVTGLNAATKARMAIQAAGAATSGGGILSSIGSGIAAIVKLFNFKSLFSGLITGAKTAFNFVKNNLGTVLKVLRSVVTGIAKLLVTPIGLIGTLTGAALYGARKYFEFAEKRSAKLSKQLEQQRQAIVEQSFADAGQTPTGPLDVANAAVAKQAPLTEAQRSLIDEINGIQTALETYRQRMKSAADLLDRGDIDQGAFDRFAKQELDRFKQNSPDIQAREQLAKQLRTPIEVFRDSIREAKRLFADDSENFHRAAREAAATFRQNDPMTQARTAIMEALKSPAQVRDEAIAKAQKLFANAPETLGKAIAAANDQYRATDPAQQIADALRSPAEIFRDTVSRYRELLGNHPELLKKAIAEARKQFQQSSPEFQKVKRIQDALVSEGAKVAKQIVEATQLMNRGLLSRDQRDAFVAKLRGDFLGENPGRQFGQLATQSAAIAGNIGAFSPDVKSERQSREAYQKRQIELQQATVDELRKVRQRGGLLT
ncbi:hypothetical protein U8335_02275 [Roseiconus lacunae]|uniref:hypothetical protein n=1 Tax=Roseiconus lacunae TaxID=2605694 RepID=UPI0030937553|nr:hypothetical protein U8335_02275 [Stieleria sp. HD01]